MVVERLSLDEGAYLYYDYGYRESLANVGMQLCISFLPQCVNLLGTCANTINTVEIDEERTFFLRFGELVFYFDVTDVVQNDVVGC